VQLIRAVDWSPDGDAVRIIDQRALPEQLVERDLRTLDAVCDAIRTLAVRGAPAIGVAGAMGMVIALLPYADEPAGRFARRVCEVADAIRATRPTAVNLPWALDRMLRLAASGDDSPRAILDALRREATAIRDEDREMCERIGEHGLALVPDGATVRTHCNAGALATAGMGTALAPIYRAVAVGRRVEVVVDETRPLLQGSRLTSWELTQAGIPVTVIADSVAASLMRAGRIDLCMVGADRIARNGDVANKVGTYGVAVAAHHHGIPMYVAAPTSTFDPDVPDGDAIEIEERHPDEVRRGFGAVTAADLARVHNPAFDVTPAALVTAIVSDRGVHRPPYDFSSGARFIAARSAAPEGA
jgi:methylthioribose-1-phosphate isomerase